MIRSMHTDIPNHEPALLMMNSGQSCNAPTRMLVPQARMVPFAMMATRSQKNFADARSWVM